MKNNANKIPKIALLLSVLGLAACAPNRSQSVDAASQAITTTLGCPQQKSLVYDSFYQMLDDAKIVPSAAAMKESLQAQMNQLKSEKNLSADQQKTLDQITARFFTVVDLMLEQTPDLNATSWNEQIQKMIQYEMQDQSSAQVIATHQKINQALAQVKTLSESLPVTCQAASEPVASPPVALVQTSPANVVTGLRRVIATAYQSCRAAEQLAMTKSTPDVAGISVVGKHADGIGSKREITNLSALQNSDYYVKNIATESSCVRVRDNPLIYDYGGQAAVSGNNLNFFQNAGSGTAVLGVDCSAFVSSAIAMSGLRYKPGLPNKAIYTRQTSSSFISAEKSGFTCFENVTVTPTQSVQAGDIIGVSGHVVAIDRVGSDPFGLAQVKTEAGCASLNYKNFDIDVAQSSPSKGGIGINKFVVRDYLDESAKMRTAFVGMAQQACLAKFQKKSVKPASADWGFIRHKGTADCLATRTTMTGEACAQSCF